MTYNIKTELEKIDILRKRMGLTYEEARLALDKAQGDVIKALEYLERDFSFEGETYGSRLWDNLKDQMRRLNKTQINLKRGDRIVFSISAPLGIAMVYTMWKRPSLRALGLIGTAGAMLNNYRLEFDSILDNDMELVYSKNYSSPVVNVDYAEAEEIYTH